MGRCNVYKDYSLLHSNRSNYRTSKSVDKCQYNYRTSKSVDKCQYDITMCKLILHTNIEMKLRNKIHCEQMHYKVGVPCIQWTWDLCSVVITRKANPPISTFSRSCNEFTSVWSMVQYNTIPKCLNCRESFTSRRCSNKTEQSQWPWHIHL